MPPRGLKKLLLKSSTGKLVRGKYTGFKAIDIDGKPTGPMLKGITKLLNSNIYSKGTLDMSATTSTEFRGGSWKGVNGGIKRGKAVDAQVSRLASAGAGKRNTSSKYKMTTLAFSALSSAGLEPLHGQRVVTDTKNGIATACDVVCYCSKDNTLVVVELKTGYSGNRTLPAVTKNNKVCMLASPCSTASDCLLHRHMAQLAVTRHMLACEKTFMQSLDTMFGIKMIRGVLLYACDRDTSVYELNDWW